MNAVSLRDIPVPAIRTDGAWRIREVNAAAKARLAGRAGVESLPLGSFFNEGDALHERLRATPDAPQGAPAVRAHLARDELETPVDLFAREEGATEGYLVLLIDASARAALQEELERLKDRLAESERERDRLGVLRRELSSSSEAPVIIGGSLALQRAVAQAERVAPSGATVLIHGETGSGKDLVARLVHARSPRSAEAFVALNCAALPETLLESELFGHERGAFTGADRQRLGKFELADRGTLFLDEIAELSMPAQAKLLRVLQNGRFERVGGTQVIASDVRLVAATHRDLARQVERGRFREDLFYRLNVFRIEVPPLRDRREDLNALAAFFHERHARRMGRPVLPVSDRSARRLLAYAWPGNVRELENAVERATLLADADAKELDIQLPDAPAPSAETRGRAAHDAPPRDVLLDLTAEQLLRLQIMHALETCEFRVFGPRGAGEKLGINPQTLLSRMDKLGIPRPRAMRRARRGDAP